MRRTCGLLLRLRHYSLGSCMPTHIFLLDRVYCSWIARLLLQRAEIRFGKCHCKSHHRLRRAPRSVTHNRKASDALEAEDWCRWCIAPRQFVSDLYLMLDTLKYCIMLTWNSVTVASIIRLTKVSVMNSNQSDVTWYMGAVLVWSCIEPFVGIFCACLPTYPPLIRLIFRKFSSTISSTLKASKSGLSYGNNSRGGTNTFHEEDNKFGGRHRVRRLGSDDELGLTNNIVGGGPMSPGMDVAREWGKVDEEMGYPMNAITVKKEVDRTSIAESDEGAPKRASRAY